jgi:hypothetical protein
MIEARQNDSIKLYFLLTEVSLGGLAGESPTVVIRRRRDGLYLKSPPSAGFGGAAVAHAMTEVDATLRPGLYSFTFDLAVADPDVTDEYTAYMANSNPPKDAARIEVVHVKPQAGFAPGETRGVYLFIALTGSVFGAPGLLPEIAIQRESDGRFLDPDLPDFVSGPAIFASMLEVDGSNQPGLYVFDFDQSVDGELGRYIAYIRETPNTIVRIEQIDFAGVVTLAPEGLPFAGIEGLTDTGLGALVARASAVSSPFVPVRYRLFAALESDLEAPEDVFADTFILGDFRVPRIRFCTEADGVTPLQPLTRYTVGMRVLDARDTPDDNEVTITVEASTSQRLRLSTGSLYNIASPEQAPGETVP